MRVGEVLRRVRNRMGWWLHFQQLFARRQTTLRLGQRRSSFSSQVPLLEPRVLLSSAPTDVSLDGSDIDENLPAGSVIGVLSTTDSDVGNSFAYSLVTGIGDDDNAAFEIVGDELKAVESFDFEAQSSYTIRLRTTDSDDLFFEKAFTITVNDLNDPPEATDDIANVVIGDSVEIDVLDNDSDSEETDLTIKSISTVSSGSAEIITLEGGGQKVRYTASGGAVGEITFTYTIEDEEGLTDTATITVDVGSYDPEPGNLLPTDDLGSPDLLNDLLDGLGPHSPVVEQPLTLPEIGSVPDMVSQANVADFLLAQFDVASHGNVSSSVSGQTLTDTITTSTELGGTFVVDVSTTTSYTRTGTENTTTGEWSYEDVFSMTYSYLTTFTHDTASLAYTLLQTGSLSYTFEAMFVDGVLTFSITDYLQIDDYLLTMTGSIEEDATPDEDNPTDWTYTNSTTVDELAAEIPDVYSGSQEITFDYSQSVERDVNDEIIDQSISQDLEIEVTDSYTTARSELWKSVSSDPEVPDSTTLLLATSTGQLTWSLISSYDQVIATGDLVSLSESFAYASTATDHSTLDLTSSLSLSSTATVGTLLMDQPTAPQTQTLTQLSTYAEEVTSSVDYTFEGQRAIDAQGDETFDVSYDYSDDVDGNSQEDSAGTYHSELTGDDELHILDTTSSLDEILTWGSSLDAIASNVKSSTGSTNTATRTYDESMTILSSSTLTSTLSKLAAPGSTSTANESVLTDEYADSIDSTYTLHDVQTAYVAADIAYYSGLSTSHLLSDESVEMTSTTLYRPSQSASETPDVIVTVIEEAEFSTDSSTDLTVTTDYDIVVDEAENTVTTNTVQTTDDVSSGVDEISLTSIVTSAGLISGSAGTGKTESTLMSIASSNSAWEYDLNDVLTTSVTVETQDTLVQTSEGDVEGVSIDMAIASTQVTTLSSTQSGAESLTTTLNSRTVLATGALADDLALVEDLDSYSFEDAETLGESLGTQDGSILIADISSSDTSSNSFTSTLDSVTTLSIEDDEITILAYGETVETSSDDDAETTLLSTTELVSENSITSSGSFSSQVFQQDVSNGTGNRTSTVLNSMADNVYASTELIEEDTTTVLSSDSASGSTSLTIDTFITQSSSGSGTTLQSDTYEIAVQDLTDGSYPRNDSFSITVDFSYTASSLSLIDVGSNTVSHDDNNDGSLSEDEIVTTSAPSTITSQTSFSTTEESTVTNVTFSEIDFVTATSSYTGLQAGTTDLETTSDMTIDADGVLDLTQTSTLESSGTVTSDTTQTQLYLNTTENEKEGYALSFSSGNDYSVSTGTTYTLNDNPLTGLTTETVLTELTSSSNTLSSNESSGSSGPALGASTSSFTGQNSVTTNSSAEVTDWREVVTDDEGQIISSAFETRRQLLDATTLSGGFAGSTPSGSYSSTFEDKTGRRVTEVHLGDEDYEYVFKDQVSGSSLTSSSSGQPSQTNRSRIHHTLEYEILNKGTPSQIIREYAEQTYRRGELEVSDEEPGGSGTSPGDSGRTRVGEYQSGGAGSLPETGWATDPQATPQGVGNGTNPSSTDGPWGGQGGPGEGDGGSGGGEEGGPGEGGSGEEGGGEEGGGEEGGAGGEAGPGTPGGNAPGTAITDTTPWLTHEPDVAEGYATGPLVDTLPWHKAVGNPNDVVQFNNSRASTPRPEFENPYWEGFKGFFSGVGTGSKAIVNESLNAGAGLLTLGFYSSPIQIPVRAHEADAYANARIPARIAPEIGLGIVTGGASQVSNVGKVFFVWDALGNTASIARGSAKVYQEGQFTVESTIELAGGLAGGAGNLAGALGRTGDAAQAAGNAGNRAGDVAEEIVENTTKNFDLSELTKQQVGDIGEEVAKRFLVENGFNDIVSIRNNSGNGIDIIAKRSNGEITFFEVKASRTGSIGKLSARQQSMKSFVEDVLRQASTGTGRYRHLNATQQNIARELLREFRSDAIYVNGYVIGVDLLNEIIRISPWR